MSKPRRRGGVYPQKVRCKATNRWGEQCAKWAMKGSVVCNKHGGAAPQVRKKAQERILMAQDDAASMLVKAMGDKRIPFSERRKVAEFLLTYENRNEVKVMIGPWQEAIEVGGILVDVGDDEIVDAEIVEDSELPTRAIPPSHVEALPSLLHDPPTHPGTGPRLR